MDLNEYINSPGAMTAAELAAAIGVTHVAQVNQWRNPNTNRRPSPENCVAIERATNGRVTRRDLRPDDWKLIWPELVKDKGAPKPADQPAKEVGHD